MTSPNNQDFFAHGQFLALLLVAILALLLGQSSTVGQSQHHNQNSNQTNNHNNETEIISNYRTDYHQSLETEPQYSSASSACRGLSFVSRRDWGAKSTLPNGAFLQPFVYTPRRVIVHQAWDGRTCADLDSCIIRLQAIQAYHQHTKGWPDISYNFLIAGDGTIYEGIGFAHAGFHTLNYNQNSLGLALIGTFHDVYPPIRMERALSTLIQCAVDSNYLAPDYLLHGHRDARCTICPGNAAYSRIATMARFQSGPLARYSCPSLFADSSSSEAPTAMTAMMSRSNASLNLSLAPQVININNSNNKLLSLAISSGASDPRPVAASSPADSSIAGADDRRQAVRQAHAMHLEPPVDDSNLLDRMEFNKSPDKQIIVINVQQPAATSVDQARQQSSSLSSSTDGATRATSTQPIFYLLTKAKPSFSKQPSTITQPAILYAPIVASPPSSNAGQSSSFSNAGFNSGSNRLTNRAPQQQDGAGGQSTGNSGGQGGGGGSSSGDSNRASGPTADSPAFDSDGGGGGGGGGGGSRGGSSTSTGGDSNPDGGGSRSSPGRGNGGFNQMGTEQAIKGSTPARELSILDRILQLSILNNINFF